MMEILGEKPEQDEEIRSIVKDVITSLGYSAAVIEVFENEKDPTLKVVAVSSEEDLSLLIGKNGQNLKAIEHVARLLAFKKNPERANFVMDINDYRKSRARFVVQHAVEVANRVKESKKAEALAPMSSYERRLVHIELASYPDVETESIGEEPKRRVVVRPLSI